MRRVALTLLGIGLGGFGLPAAAARAHHPRGDAGSPWVWVGLLAFVLTFGAIWIVTALLERRPPPSQPEETPEREEP
jgi:hypothetical protein